MPVPPVDWTEPVIAFLRDNLPKAGKNGWNHMFSTAYEIGCMALVGLGQAEETVWGAMPKAEPQLPAVLPLWEDICVAVLWLAEQQGKIEYPGSDRSLPDPRNGEVIIQPQIKPDTAEEAGTGQALVTPDLLPVLTALGLISDECWTDAAELVHWRNLPTDWRLSFDEDERFLSAIDAAVAGLPTAIRAKIDQLMVISTTDIEQELAKAWLGKPRTAEQVRRSLTMSREHELDWLFFRNWRFAQGWLDADQAARALEIFHDQLASSMRRAVMERLYPDGFVLA